MTSPTQALIAGKFTCVQLVEFVSMTPQQYKPPNNPQKAYGSVAVTPPVPHGPLVDPFGTTEPTGPVDIDGVPAISLSLGDYATVRLVRRNIDADAELKVVVAGTPLNLGSGGNLFAGGVLPKTPSIDMTISAHPASLPSPPTPEGFISRIDVTHEGVVIASLVVRAYDVLYCRVRLRPVKPRGDEVTPSVSVARAKSLMQVVNAIWRQAGVFFLDDGLEDTLDLDTKRDVSAVELPGEVPTLAKDNAHNHINVYFVRRTVEVHEQDPVKWMETLGVTYPPAITGTSLPEDDEHVRHFSGASQSRTGALIVMLEQHPLPHDRDLSGKARDVDEGAKTFTRTDEVYIGHALAHELGHYLGLRHPREDSTTPAIERGLIDAALLMNNFPSGHLLPPVFEDAHGSAKRDGSVFARDQLLRNNLNVTQGGKPMGWTPDS